MKLSSVVPECGVQGDSESSGVWDEMEKIGLWPGSGRMVGVKRRERGWIVPIALVLAPGDYQSRDALLKLEGAQRRRS